MKRQTKAGQKNRKALSTMVEEYGTCHSQPQNVEGARRLSRRGAALGAALLGGLALFIAMQVGSGKSCICPCCKRLLFAAPIGPRQWYLHNKFCSCSKVAFKDLYCQKKLVRLELGLAKGHCQTRIARTTTLSKMTLATHLERRFVSTKL